MRASRLARFDAPLNQAVFVEGKATLNEVGVLTLLLFLVYTFSQSLVIGGQMFLREMACLYRQMSRFVMIFCGDADVAGQ